MHGHNLVEAARESAVPQFRHPSVSGTGAHHRSASDGGAQSTATRNYWESKAATEELVKAADFPSWTLIKPAFFMENFIRPSMTFDEGGSGKQPLTVLSPDTEVAMIAVQDIGSAAAAAIADPTCFLELASDVRTMRQIAKDFSEALGHPIDAPSFTVHEALARGLMPMAAHSRARLNHHRRPARPEQARALGIPLTDFPTWLPQHRL